jgi:hypothetical protein
LVRWRFTFLADNVLAFGTTHFPLMAESSDSSDSDVHRYLLCSTVGSNHLALLRQGHTPEPKRTDGPAYRSGHRLVLDDDAAAYLLPPAQLSRRHRNGLGITAVVTVIALIRVGVVSRRSKDSATVTRSKE